MSRPSSTTSVRSSGEASTSSAIAAGYLLPPSEAGPSRTASLSRRSSRSTASITNSRKGKERAIDDGHESVDPETKLPNGPKEAAVASEDDAGSEEGSESEEEEEDDEEP